MDYRRFRARCVWMMHNNGITKAMFEPRENQQPEHVWVNLENRRGLYEEGKDYWITIEPAFPH